MLEEVLYGYDVLPSAVHITAATLAGAQPRIGFNETHLDSLPYGRLSDGSVAIGSLEFLKSNSQLTFSNFSDPARRVSGEGEQPTPHTIAEANDDSFDLVIMNPPFTRNTNKSGVYANTFAGAFAALNSSNQDQKDMARRMAFLKEDTCYHGHAGMASAFAALANRKLKVGGMLALVLPLSAATGFAWQSFRQLLSDNYTDVAVLTIAAPEDGELSFSADTGIAECLVLARKLKSLDKEQSNAVFVSLKQRPRNVTGAKYIATSIIQRKDLRRMGDGPLGGSPVAVGNSSEGEMLSALYPSDGNVWGAVRLSDFSLAQSSYALSNSALWLPGSPSPMNISMASLDQIGSMGHHHLDIIGMPSSGIPQGPFDKTDP